MATAQLLVLPSSMGGPLSSHRTTATYAAVQSMPMTPARRRRFYSVNAGVHDALAQQPRAEYVAACHQRRGLISQLLGKRRHRGR